jgi:hypothetical protein
MTLDKSYNVSYHFIFLFVKIIWLVILKKADTSQSGDFIFAKEANVFSFFKFVYSHVHTLFGSFLPPNPAPSLSFPPPLLPGRICSALISNFVEEKT